MGLKIDQRIEADHVTDFDGDILPKSDESTCRKLSSTTDPYSFSTIPAETFDSSSVLSSV